MRKKNPADYIGCLYKYKYNHREGDDKIYHLVIDYTIVKDEVSTVDKKTGERLQGVIDRVIIISERISGAGAGIIHRDSIHDFLSRFKEVRS